MPKDAVFDQERIAKIREIMPKFADVAMVGDRVMMGLQGDPMDPYKGNDRPTATIVNKSADEVTLKMADNSRRTVSKYAIAPKDVWEFTDDSFKNVLTREKAKVMEASRAETTTVQAKSNDLASEVAQLRSELATERNLTRDFHKTYIASMRELAADVCKIDAATGNKHASFCRTFRDQYSKMESRGELGIFRGAEDCESESDSDVAESTFF